MISQINNQFHNIDFNQYFNPISNTLHKVMDLSKRVFFGIGCSERENFAFSLSFGVIAVSSLYFLNPVHYDLPNLHHVPCIFSSLGCFTNFLELVEHFEQNELKNELKIATKSLREITRIILLEAKSKQLFTEEELDEKSPEFLIASLGLLILKLIQTNNFDFEKASKYLKFACSKETFQSCRELYSLLDKHTKEVVIKILIDQKEIESIQDEKQKVLAKNLTAKIKEITYMNLNNKHLYKTLYA